jgi:hypothetical protein
VKKAFIFWVALLCIGTFFSCQQAASGNGAPASSSKDITAFGIVAPAATGTITGTAIAITVPYGTSVSALVASFTTTGASVKVGSTVQTSGVTPNNFTSPVTYTVTAADGSTQAYTITVSVASASSKAITAFSIVSPAAAGTITEATHSIAITVPYNTSVLALVANFTITGASVKVGSTIQTSGGTPNNFTSPVTYTVMAADASTQDYIVTVSIQPSGTQDPAWGKRLYSGTGKSNCVKVDSSGNVYIVGSGTNLVGASTGKDWWIRKFSPGGVEDAANWNKIYDGSSHNDDEATSIAIDGSDNVYVLGTTNYFWQDSFNIQCDWWIKKFSSNGVEDTTHWNKIVDNGSLTDDEATAIAIDGLGNIYAVGSYGTGGSGQQTGWWIKKYAPNGTEDTANWNKKLTAGFTWPMIAEAIDFDSSNNVYIAGTSNDDKSWVIRKFSSSGTEDTANWNKTITMSYSSYPYSLVVNKAAGLIYVGGCANSHGLIKKYSSSGAEDTFNWNKTIDGGHGGPDAVYGLAVDGNQNIFSVGIVDLVSGGVPYACMIKKYTSYGVEDTSDWNKQIQLGQTEGAKSIAFDSADYAYVISDSWFIWKFMN